MFHETAGHLGAFLQQRDFCLIAGCPITALVAEASGHAVNRETALGRTVLDWQGDPSADAVPLRVIGGLRSLDLAGDDATLTALFAGSIKDLAEATAVVATALRRHDKAMCRWLEQPPQTNETGRAAGLLAGILAAVEAHVGMPLEILEIGSSAGLNLLMDRLGFDLGGTRFGRDDAPLVLRPEWRGAAPPKVDIAFRTKPRGVDLKPIDVRDDAAAARLRAYVWADARQRLDRLEAGIAIARDAGVRVDRGDAAEWLEERLREPQAPRSLRVLMHSAVWKYLGLERQMRLTAAMHEAGARATVDRPLAWVRMEPDAATATTPVIVQRWPERPEPKCAAVVDLHGEWVEPRA